MVVKGVVLVGAGARGRIWRDAVMAHPDWDLAGIVDIDPAAAHREGSAAGLDATRCFTSIEAALSMDGIGATIVATPHDRHVGPCRAAIDRGVATLVEKPFAPSVAEGAELVRLAEERAVPLLVGQNYRYLRSFRAARALIEDGTLGRVGIVTMQYYRPWKDLEPSLRDIDNSILWGMAPHHLDTVVHLTGSKIEWISAHMASVFDRSGRAGASMHAIAGLEDDIQFTYAATYEAVGQDRFEGGREFYMRITGDAGTLHVFHRWLFLTKPGALPRAVRRGPRPSTEEATLLSQLRDAVRTGMEAPCSGRDNLYTVAALEACLRSSAERRPVRPQDLLGDVLAG